MKKTAALRSLILCGFLALFSAAVETASNYHRTARYDDQLVVQCDFSDSQRLTHFLQLEFVDPWGFDNEGRVHVRLSDQLWSELQSTLPECSVVIENVEEYVLAAEMQMISKSPDIKAETETMDASKGQEWFKVYHPYEDIVEWCRNLTRDYSGISRFVESIGVSSQGRNIPAVHFTGTETPEYTVYFQCQIHAREWISGAVCMYVAQHLCEKYQKQKEVTQLLNKLEFVFVPIVNPDGYEYTWNGDRLWRKNRRVNPGSSCMGVDINRNYNDHWGGIGSSNSTCSEAYHGESAVSEPETQATMQYFKVQNMVIGAIDWHSYSQLILRPYGWSHDECPDEDKLKDMGDKISADIKEASGSNYTSERSAYLYLASGVASDWFYGEEATSENEGYRAASYTIELRPSGTERYGFELPSDQIIPTAEEVVPAIINFAEAILADPIVNN